MPGLIHIYCGDGKGKTTAAMGLAIRAAGSGRRVLILQFLKDGRSSEFASIAHVPNIEVIPQTKRFGFTWTLSEEEKVQAREYYTSLMEDAFARAGDFGLLVLDEAVGACASGMIDEARLLALLGEKPGELEVVLTGRGPSQALMDAAGYVTEMVKRKHPFDQGVPARKGIEF